ncbi:hypothetical protein NC653_038555 [Populus alba x Populus x berolinensis]|uniref:Uncharacterized protein n=1 Tax=Populus alba x Populus x berolinensis TaxID=444605 RepID=A0AAD6LII6_9ROSI|nr:hypothetical protein NC653_038555 [Populus alba x Populus x berolinensis]
MAFTLHHYTLTFSPFIHQNTTFSLRSYEKPTIESQRLPITHCSINQNNNKTLRTCKNCKTQFDPSLNHPRACRFHTAHFGGETKRKFESVYSGGTMNTPDSGQVFQYWHCCGSEDPFDAGCTAAPHSSYDD